MKKNTYFIISSILMILLSVYSILLSKETIKQSIKIIKETYNGFSENFVDRVINVYERSGVAMLVFFAIIVIVASFIILISAKNNTLLKYKGMIIGLLVLCFVFSNITLVQLLSVVGVIIMACSKGEKIESKKSKISKIELYNPGKKEFVFGILLLMVYFLQLFWSKYIPNDFKIALIIEISFNIVMLLLCILIFFNQLKENFKCLKKNIKGYAAFIFSRIGIAYLLLFVTSLISLIVTKNATSVNQESIEKLPKFYSIPAAIIYAPIVEEILFRGIVRRIIKNDTIFIIISGLVFGLLHTISEASITNVIFMSLPYVSLGAYFAYIYTKTNNIYTSIISHAAINTISAIFILFL